jgi:hypothetical protein
VGIILVGAGCLVAVAAIVVNTVPEPFRMAVGLFEEFTRSVEEEERLLADEVARVDGVISADPAESGEDITRIRVTVGGPVFTPDTLSLVSGRCTSHGALMDIFETRPVVCTVVTPHGRVLATYTWKAETIRFIEERDQSRSPA